MNNDFIYKPPENNSEPQESEIYVKFANNYYLYESFLKKHNIEYKDEDLEDTPMGRAFVVRKKTEGDRV